MDSAIDSHLEKSLFRILVQAQRMKETLRLSLDSNLTLSNTVSLLEEEKRVLNENLDAESKKSIACTDANLENFLVLLGSKSLDEVFEFLKAIALIFGTGVPGEIIKKIDRLQKESEELAKLLKAWKVDSISEMHCALERISNDLECENYSMEEIKDRAEELGSTLNKIRDLL